MAMTLNREGGIQNQLVEDDALFEATQKLIVQGLINSEDVGRLQEAGIRDFSGLMKHISENPSGVTGSSKAKLEQIYEASEIILEKKAENQWKITNTIEVKSLMQCYLKHKKRITDLTTSIALNTTGGATCSWGQLQHWERELQSCKKRVANIEENNFKKAKK